MSYVMAKASFDENLTLYLNRVNDPVMFNLNVGLSNLAQQLAIDMNKIETRQQKLETDLRSVMNSVKQMQQKMRI